MNVLIAPDSFKGTMSAEVVAKIIKNNLKMPPKSNIVTCPMSDGGEGFSKIVTAACGGKIISKKVEGPNRKPVSAEYGLIPDKDKTAVVDISSASGLELLPPEKRDPVNATTFGTGELISDALSKKSRRIILGLGGSATNDCGAGILSALGIRFYTSNSIEIKNLCGGNLSYVSFIDVSNAKSLSKKTKFILACDVDNPLTGKNGAAYVFAPQKGASDEAVVFLDKALADFAGILKKYTGKNISEMKHGGAAGGTAAGLSAFFDTEIKSGFDIVSSAVGLERKIMQSDIVITGEGCTDKQTLHGKLPVKVSELAAKHGKRCILISGRILLDDRELDSAGFDLCYGTARAEDSEDGIIKNAELRLAETAAEIELNKFS